MILFLIIWSFQIRCLDKMLKLIRYFLISLIYIITINQNICYGEIKILFKVNNEIITSQDILNELKYLKSINKEFKQSNDKQAFEVSKNSLIREKVKEIELKRITKKIKINDRMLNNVLLSYFKDLGIESVPGFEKFFLDLNLMPDNIRRKITIEVMWNQLIFSKFKQNVKIDKELIKKNLSKKKKQKEFLISEILFNVDKNENLDKKFELIIKNINKTNFSQTAINYSVSDTANKGGLVGWIRETSLNTKISDQLNKLKISEFTKPIVVPGGFLILKIDDVRDAAQNFNLNDEVNKIIEKKTNEQLNQFSNIYFNKVKRDMQINAL
tara:strand:+ start:1400 stop:2380 length:981 start_codon:yes stop_codon:yes gene_type:complete